MNNIKVFGLMAGMTALFGALGAWFGGQSGMVMALLFAGVMNVVMYYNSSKMVLRMYNAHVVDESQAPDLYRMVDRLRQRAGLPMPTVAIAPHEQPNAFATGRNPENAVVCLTEGILRLMPAVAVSVIAAGTPLPRRRRRRTVPEIPGPDALRASSTCVRTRQRR